MTTESDIQEIAQLPLVTGISKGRVNTHCLTVQPVYDKDFEVLKDMDLEYADEVYVYENALGATYACFMTAGQFRYFARVTAGVEVVITERIYNAQS